MRRDNSVFLVESGSADVLVEGEKVREVGPGEVLGEVAVLASGRRTASVVATSSVQVIAFFKPDVWGLERDAPEAARRLRAARGSTSGHHLGLRRTSEPVTAHWTCLSLPAPPLSLSLPAPPFRVSLPASP